MKKKIFLTLLIVSMLVCLFAISASATVATYDDAPERTNIEVSTDDIVVFDDGFSCPTGYVFKDQSTISDGSWGSPALKSCFDFSYINEKTGNTYTFENIVELDLPQGLTSIGKFLALQVTTLRKISFPDSVTSLGIGTFQACTSIEECVFEHTENSNFTELPQYLFYGASNLKAFSMPDCITSLTGEGAHFTNCSSLKAVYLSKKLTTISCTNSKIPTFDYCTNVYFVNEPFTYDSIPEKPTVYYFPDNLENLPNQCIFRGCKGLNDVLVFGTKITELSNQYLFQNSPANIVVLLGDMTNVVATYWGTNEIIFANPNDVDAASAGLTTRVGTSSGEAYYCNAENNTTHLAEKTVDVEARCEVDAGKVTYCFCGYEISKEAVDGTALSHDYDYVNNENAKLVSITYANYSANGVKMVTCANCGTRPLYLSWLLSTGRWQRWNCYWLYCKQ